MNIIFIKNAIKFVIVVMLKISKVIIIVLDVEIHFIMSIMKQVKKIVFMKVKNLQILIQILKLILINYAIKDALLLIQEVMILIIIIKNMHKIVIVIIFTIFFMMKKENVLVNQKNLQILIQILKLILMNYVYKNSLPVIYMVILIIIIIVKHV